MRDKIGAIASDVAAHFQLVENIKSLQAGQKEMAVTIKELGDRIRALETELRVLKAETKFEALRETQTIVNAVQGGLNDRIQTLAVDLALVEKTLSSLSPRPPNGSAPPQLSG